MRQARWALPVALLLCSFVAAAARADSAATIDGTIAGALARCVDAARREDGDAVMTLCGAVIDSGTASEDDKAHALANRGTAYLARQDQAHALEDLTHGLKLKPDMAALRSLRGQIYAAQGDLPDAIADLSEAIKLEPGSGALYSVRGDVQAAAGATDAALSDYIEAIRLTPCRAATSACEYRRAGIIAFSSGDDDRANLEFAKALDEPDAPEDVLTSDRLYTLLWQALALQRGRRDDTTALAAGTEGLDLSRWPGPLVRYYLGRIPEDELQQAAQDSDPATAVQQACDLDFYVASRALVDGRASAAAAGFEAALQACPPTRVEFDAAKAGRLAAARPVPAQMAQDMTACADTNDAGVDSQTILAACDTALRHPAMPDAWQFNALIISAAASHRLGDDATAAAMLDRALALRPGSPDAYRRRGIYRMAGGDVKGGLVDFDHAIALNPELMAARMSRGWALADREDWPGATADFTDAIETDPYNPRLYVARGVVAFLSGDDAHAAENFGRAIDVAPQGAPYALIWLKLALQRSPRDVGDRLQTGAAALDLGRWPGPILRFLEGGVSRDELAAADPSGGCESAFYPGVAALVAGRSEAAKADLTQAKTACADSSLEAAVAGILLRKL